MNQTVRIGVALELSGRILTIPLCFFSKILILNLKICEPCHLFVVIYNSLRCFAGGYGRYQKRLILEMVPIILTSVLCVNMIVYITPSIICEMKITKYEQGLLFSAIFLG